MRPFARFLIVGGVGFFIDSSVTYVLIGLNAKPSLARLPAIGLAMLATWLINREFTYKVEKSKTFQEASRYFLVGIVFSLFNYLLYLLLVHFFSHPILSIAAATALQAFLSFHAYRHFAFRQKFDE